MGRNKGLNRVWYGRVRDRRKGRGGEGNGGERNWVEGMEW